MHHANEGPLGIPLRIRTHQPTRHKTQDVQGWHRRFLKMGVFSWGIPKMVDVAVGFPLKPQTRVASTEMTNPTALALKLRCWGAWVRLPL